MQTYFDKRESREKPIPDCSRVGCVWDKATQRCERISIVEQLMNYYDYNNEDYYSDGLGFLPGPAIAGAAAAGPVGWIVAGVGTAISALWSLFGGDDQATNYRPPADASQRFVEFNDSYGNERVSYDMGAQTQQITASRGNRWDDVSSYYSAFISNSTRSGASEAARRVIEDVARQRGVSISRAADLVLQAAGAIRIVQNFLPGPGAQQGGQSGQTSLPGYCPAGTYHPFEDPFTCVPFPEWGSQSGSQSGQSGSQSGSGGQSGAMRSGNIVSTAAGALKYWLNPRTGKMEPVPPCPQGQVFNTTLGQCAKPEGLIDILKRMPLPIWIILAIVIALMLSGSNSGESTTTITRRRK